MSTLKEIGVRTSLLDMNRPNFYRDLRKVPFNFPSVRRRRQTNGKRKDTS